ncbi:MAG: hypothetical protein J6Q38_03340 [Clostridia bacterium]|nr:hypothetical protein [Clostridia bacterium]
MNLLFSAILVASILILIFTNPKSILTALSKSANSAITLSITLLGIYAIWLGINNLIFESGISNKISKLLKKPIKYLFKTDNDKEITLISSALATNMLGLGSASTPLSISAMEELDKSNNEYGKTMLFVISCSSVQILPVSVMQLLVENGSQNPSIIFLPSLICSIISTFIGVLLVKIFS